MDIDFLKSKSAKTKKEVKPKNFGVDYTEPNFAAVKKNKTFLPLPAKKEEKKLPVKKVEKKLPVKNSTKAITPNIPPIKNKEKISWWQKIKTKFAAKPKPAVIAVPKPLPAPVVPPAPPIVSSEYKLTTEARGTASKKEIVLPPVVVHKENLKSLAPQDAMKIKKGELSSSFLDVNLIPDKLIAGLSPITKIRRIIWAGIASLVFILIISAGILAYQTYLINQVISTQREIKNVEDEIITYVPWQKDAVAFNQQIDGITKLLDRHIYWTEFFSFLEQNTLPNVHYANLSVDTSGVFTLAATAPDYGTVSKQIAVFKQSDIITKVSVVGATDNGTQINFNISLTVTPSIFYHKSTL